MKLVASGRVSLLTGKPIMTKNKTKTRQVEQVRFEISELERKVKNLKEKKAKTEASIQAAIKFPVPDEDIMKNDPKGSKPKKLPDPMGCLNVPDDIAHDVLMVWDCIFTYQKQLRLTEFALDDFCELLQWTNFSSVALTELCSALLRVILNDDRLVGTLSIYTFLSIYIHIYMYMHL